MKKTIISLLLIALLFYAATFTFWRMQKISEAARPEQTCHFCELNVIGNLDIFDYAMGFSLLIALAFTYASARVFITDSN